jgi:hypothetical protein
LDAPALALSFGEIPLLADDVPVRVIHRDQSSDKKTPGCAVVFSITEGAIAMRVPSVHGSDQQIGFDWC